MSWPPFPLVVGQPVPALERTIGSADMIAYAGATWDWHRLHYDAVYLSALGLDAPVVDGQVLGALLVEQLQDWLGPWSFVRVLDYRFKGLVFAGERVRCDGEIADLTAGVVQCSLTVVVIDAAGATLRPAVVPARAEIIERP